MDSFTLVVPYNSPNVPYVQLKKRRSEEHEVSLESASLSDFSHHPTPVELKAEGLETQIAAITRTLTNFSLCGA
jgi:hypothetical protein